jgi:broad specificity phosphatase PhoE
VADDRVDVFKAALEATNRRHLIGVAEATELWLVRHADAYDGLAVLDDGLLDPPLSPLGRRQAGLLAKRLAQAPVDGIWASDLIRARETAEIVAAPLGLSVAVDPRLREVRTHWDEGGEQRFRTEESYPFPEPQAEVVARLSEAQEHIVAQLGPPRGRARRAVVVTHAGAIMTYVSHVLGLEWGRLPILTHFTSVTVLATHEGRTVVQSLADITHLATLDQRD